GPGAATGRRSWTPSRRRSDECRELLVDLRSRLLARADTRCDARPVERRARQHDPRTRRPDRLAECGHPTEMADLELREGLPPATHVDLDRWGREPGDVGEVVVEPRDELLVVELGGGLARPADGESHEEDIGVGEMGPLAAEEGGRLQREPS